MDEWMRKKTFGGRIDGWMEGRKVSTGLVIQRPTVQATPFPDSCYWALEQGP